MAGNIDLKKKITIMEQDEEDSGMVCGSCRYNIRVPECGDWGRVKCYCALDNHYIGYNAMAWYSVRTGRKAIGERG